MKKIIFTFLVVFVLTACTEFNGELVGEVSNTPWQHMIELQAGYPYQEYIDFEDGDQLVVYSKEQIDCPRRVKLKGDYIQIVGESKRPGSKEEYIETQFVADEFECVD